MLTSTWRLFLLLTLLSGYLYPLVTTGLAQIFFPWSANGSMLYVDNQAVGSKWIGQPFSSDAYFWGRPSATQQGMDQRSASGGSNRNPNNPALLKTLQTRIIQHHWVQQPIPGDLVTASGSGLDPEISPAAAYYQVERVATARRRSVAEIRDLIASHVSPRTFHCLGEARVNVLELNLALDRAWPQLRAPRSAGAANVAN